MSHVTDAIKERRSIRKYTTHKVTKEEVNEVLAAAAWAPSAHNAQPWRFIVLEEANSKRELTEAMAESWAADMAKNGVPFDPEKRVAKSERFANAPVLIIACLTMEGMEKYSDEKRQETERDLAMQSLGASIQNLLLAAQAKGLGACWFSAPSFCKQTVRKILGVPEEVEPQALITMGYPAEKTRIPAKKPLEEICFRNKWGNRLGPDHY